jgi:hypothetical protein
MTHNLRAPVEAGADVYFPIAKPDLLRGMIPGHNTESPAAMLELSRQILMEKNKLVQQDGMFHLPLQQLRENIRTGIKICTMQRADLKAENKLHELANAVS